MNALQGIEGRVEWSEIAAPSCGQGEIRIRVAAAGLNRADLLQKAGLYPPPPGASPALGLECAGVVSEVGAGSTWQVGDRVCALLAGGGMAEEVVVDARHVLPVPAGLEPGGGGGDSGGLRHGLAEPVPVGGVAARRESAAARRRQRRRFGRHPIVQGVRQPLLGQRRFRRTPGLLRIPGRRRRRLRKQSLESLRDFAPFDVILDPVGARYAGLNLELLRRDGRWVIIGLMGGREAQLDLAQLLGKRIQLTGSTLRTRDAEFKAQLIAELGLKVWPLFSAGKLRAQLERTFPIGDAEAAFEALASNQVQGKVVLVVDPSLA